jgi:hypothetical protein
MFSELIFNVLYLILKEYLFHVYGIFDHNS